MIVAASSASLQALESVDVGGDSDMDCLAFVAKQSNLCSISSQQYLALPDVLTHPTALAARDPIPAEYLSLYQRSFDSILE